MTLIRQHYPKYSALYQNIYKEGDISYWNKMEDIILEMCETLGVDAKIYFHHGVSPAKQNGEVAQESPKNYFTFWATPKSANLVYL